MPFSARKVFGLFFVFYSFYVIIPSKTVAAWNSTTPFSVPIASATAHSFLNKIFLLGGASGAVYDVPSQVSVLPDGNLLSWSVFGDYFPNFWHTSVLLNSRLYVLGGASFPNVTPLDNVSYANLDSNGNVGSWISTSNLPIGLAQTRSAVFKNGIYISGGFNNDKIYFATANIDGTLNSWQDAGTMPSKLWGHNMAISGNKLIIAGGKGPSGKTSQVLSAEIQSDGSLGPWINMPSLPRALYRGEMLLLGNKLFFTGGEDDQNSYQDAVYTSTIDVNGNPQNWILEDTKMPKVSCCHSLTSIGKRLYLIGGHDGHEYYKDVWWSDVDVVLPPDPTPMPTVIPTSTPTAVPTPTPTTSPYKTTKVILVPGMGGSWNSDALLNCKDTGYKGSWTLASYAENVYQPLVNVMAGARMTTNIFNYDWRKPVETHSSNLKTYIDAQTLPGEKVFLVGHSMGGLVAEAFLENPVNRQKVDRFVAIGTPFEGMTWAYPAWAAGELWHDDFKVRLASEIALARCGATPVNRRSILRRYLPSSQQLLPTFNYLDSGILGGIIDVNTMLNRNNWLPREISWNMPGGTLSGYNKKTLSGIKVKTPGFLDTRLGNWDDGKVSQKKYSNDGDGMVLTHSAEAYGDRHKQLELSHDAIVGTKSGSNAVLEMLTDVLASPLRSSETFVESTSAIVVIGDDASVNGDENIKVIINPKKQKYDLKLIPKKDRSKVNVGYFFGNGDTKWKTFSILGLKSRNASILWDDGRDNDLKY